MGIFENVGVVFILVAIVLFIIFQKNNAIDGKKFINDSQKRLRFLMEDDYSFLVKVRYGDVTENDIDKLYSMRIRNAMIAFLLSGLLFMGKILSSNISGLLFILVAIVIGFVFFKLSYIKLSQYYKSNLHQIDLLLPYYLKSLEILCQHYTIPVAMKKSVETAPEIFKAGLQRLVNKIDAGDSSIDPYMDFAKEYPVRDSMRMMRLLYRLSLGSQENKQEQLLMFSRTISSLQNKAREQKYQERLNKMEQKTLIMLGCTGGGVLLILLYSMMNMMSM